MATLCALGVMSGKAKTDSDTCVFEVVSTARRHEGRYPFQTLAIIPLSRKQTCCARPHHRYGRRKIRCREST